MSVVPRHLSTWFNSDSLGPVAIEKVCVAQMDGVMRADVYVKNVRRCGFSADGIPKYPVLAGLGVGEKFFACNNVAGQGF